MVPCSLVRSLVFVEHVIGQRNLKVFPSQLTSGSSLQNEGSFSCGGGLEVGFVRAKLVIGYLRILEEVIDYFPTVRALVSRDTESIVRYASLNFCTHLPLFILLLFLGILLSLLDLVPFVGLIAELLVVDGTHNFGELGELALHASNLLLVHLHGRLGVAADYPLLIT